MWNMDDLLTPSEIIRNYPECPFDNWDLGRLLSMGLLKGKKLDRGCLIDKSSFELLLKFHHSVNPTI